MDFRTYKFLIAGIFVLWGITNFTNGFNLFDDSQLNLMKGVCAISIGFIIAFAHVQQRITRPGNLL